MVSLLVNSGRRKTLRPSRKDIVAPLFRFAPHELNIRENSRACSSSRKVCSVFMGLNHPECDENGRAPMGASPVGFHDATLRTASGRGCVKHGVAGKCLEALRGIGKPFVLKGFGCAYAVRVALRSFHDGLIGHQLPAEPTESPPWILRRIQAIKSAMLIKCRFPLPWAGMKTD